MKSNKIEMITEKQKIAEGRDQTVDVLVRITPPVVESPSERPKMNLSLVLDRSGSMNGEKMEEAKAAAAYCVDQLLPDDRMSLVIFDDEVETLIPSAPAGNPELYKKLIATISARSSTALHEAWVRGGLEVSEHLETERVNRVVLITDGQANVGETRTEKIVSHVRELARKGVSTSTIGIGRDFNEDLLVPMAEAGEGNPWHVREAADMKRIFETELGGALNQIGCEVTMKLVAGPGIRVTDVLNDFKVDGDGRYLLPNLIGGRPLEIVVRLAVPAGVAGEGVRLLAVDLEFTDQRSGKVRKDSAAKTVEFGTVAEVETLAANGDVARAAVLLMSARARAEAILAMDRGDFAGARSRVNAMRSNVVACYSMEPSPELLHEIEQLSEDFEDLAMRSSDLMTRKKMAYAAHHRRYGR